MPAIDTSIIQGVSERSNRGKDPRTRTGRRSSLTPATGLLVAIEILEAVEHDIAAQGMDEEAASVATVVADLSWQHEELTRRRDTSRRAVVAIRQRPGDQGESR